MVKLSAEKKQESRTWTVAEAKARLSEILRRAEEHGPQRIGTRKEFVVVPARVWDEHNEPRQALGQWLIENMPRFGEFEVPPRHDGRERPAPFADWTEDDWKAVDQQHADRDAGE